MIFYFSATGNCRHAARVLAQAVGERACSVQDFAGQRYTPAPGEIFGFVTPTYAFRLPTVAERFLTETDLSAAAGAYSFTVSAYGTTPGLTGEQARRLLAAQGVALSAQFSVQTPDTWTPMFDLSDKEAVAARNAQSDRELTGIAARIAARDEGRFARRALPWAVKPFADLYYDRMRRTQHFRLTEKCIGCGQCARGCPVQAIEMRGRRPVWVREQCAMCLGCLHRCPAFAIQYGGSTQRHGQYTHPDKAR